jgi:DNA-directed RNA polymerase subunit alpha
MTKSGTSFFSCLESRVEQDGEMYARFYLGKFSRGQALTLINPLRRVLLGEMPALIINTVEIAGVNHEFSILDGVQENVLDLLLNLKGLVFALTGSHSSFLKNDTNSFTGYLNVKGPNRVTGHDIKLPHGLTCVNPDHYIATITIASQLQIHFQIKLVDQRNTSTEFGASKEPENTSTTFNLKEFENKFSKKTFYLDAFPAPVRRVNYVIQDLDTVNETESITLEVWTDGSLQPHQAVEFAFQQLTYQFYTFTKLSKRISTEIPNLMSLS